MNTLLEILNLSENFLKERQIDRPRREAEELLADVLRVRRIDLYLQFERLLLEGELEKMRAALKRRARGEPLQYISGRVNFSGVDLTVSSAVLIPRPETEILVEKIASVLDKRLLKGKVLWDVGCGSGCIGIALKKRFPELRVILSDISSEALAVAQENAEANDAEVSFREGDLFEPFAAESCHFFVSNPPYVSEEEFSELACEIREFQPKRAHVSGPTGLECYEQIAASLDAHLLSPGYAWLEIGAGQGAKIQEIFQKQGLCGGVVEPDWAGHDRFFSLEKDSFLRLP